MQYGVTLYSIMNLGELCPDREWRNGEMKYCTRINVTGFNNGMEYTEFERPRFGRRDHDNIVLSMFYLAALGCEFNHLEADLCSGSCDDNFGPDGTPAVLLHYESNTVVDGSTIYMNLFVNGHHLRTMTIAS